MRANQINQFIRLPEVKSITGMSKPTIYLWMKENRFPKAIKVGERSVAWIATEIDAWMKGRINARDEQANGGGK